MSHKYIDIPPDAPMLIESTRSIGYTLEAAIADIIDNSISAEARKIEISYFPIGKPYIAIFDNGIGMTAEKLTEAMRFGSSNPNNVRDSNDLGRFGLGMKTASLSQCQCLTVISKQKDNISARQWDLNHIKETSKWSLKCLNDKELLKLPFYKELQTQTSGTIVIWEDLDRVFIGGIDESVMTSKMNTVCDHLALVFHRYLKGGDVQNKIKILMNNVEIEGFDPFFTSKSRLPMAEERIELPEYNSTVIVQPFTLPHHSKMNQKEIDKYGLRNMQGFYVYRNKRLLKWGTWFRLAKMEELSKLARVRIDIPNTLDELWSLDVKKSAATPPEIIKIRLRQIIDNIIQSSKHTYTFRSKRDIRQDNDIVHIWDVQETREGTKYKLNKQHPLYEKLTEMIDDDTKKVLDGYIFSIAESFPIKILQIDISNETRIIKEDQDTEFSNIKENIDILLRPAETNTDRRIIIERLITSEPFCNYVKKIREIYGVNENEDT
ncbi:MAG: ATP-binding protein [Candidatus Cloacimonetes bacterium]|nr:ATP-binding protein [Candidatus Cloacimonadota bacterium]